MCRFGDGGWVPVTARQKQVTSLDPDQGSRCICAADCRPHCQLMLLMQVSELFGILQSWPCGHKWRDATAQARQAWADGTVHYQVEIDLRGDNSASTRMYRWPQPGLRAMRWPRCGRRVRVPGRRWAWLRRWRC
ncbi:hypothetical protein GCM10010104_35190 [Streptomyces indiaensis]|uniref:Uncharacterized protein n=1 Tax=Streptomyces indiaensis TaxID=284033 RepID=A0ABP5QIT9_9ACTN